MKKYLLKIMLLMLFTMDMFPLLAQENDPHDPYAGGDPPAPIDNWAIFLIIAGIGLATYFLLRQKQKSIA